MQADHREKAALDNDHFPAFDGEYAPVNGAPGLRLRKLVRESWDSPLQPTHATSIDYAMCVANAVQTWRALPHHWAWGLFFDPRSWIPSTIERLRVRVWSLAQPSLHRRCIPEDPEM